MAQSEHIKLGYLRDPENHEMYFPYTHYLGVIGLDTHVNGLIQQRLPSISISGHTITVDSTSLDVPYLDGTTFTFGSSSFGLLTDIAEYLTNSSSGTSNLSADTTNPYLRLLKKNAGSDNFAEVLTTQFKGSVDSNDFGIAVTGKSDKTINFSLTGADDLAAIEALTDTNGYLKKTAANTWTLDPYGGGAVESVYSDGTAIATSTTAGAGLKKAGDTPTYQKISVSALVNDNVDTLVLNGNFS